MAGPTPATQPAYRYAAIPRWLALVGPVAVAVNDHVNANVDDHVDV